MAAGRRRSGILIIILALLLLIGVGAAYFLFRNTLMPQQAFQPTTELQPAAGNMVNIVITTQFVARGTSLTENVLTTVPYPEKDLVQGTFYTNVADAVGKKAKYDLEARLPLTSSLIVDSQVGSAAAFQIPKGMVAIVIPISRLTAVSFAPQPGDHVNVIVSLMLTDVDPTFQTRLPNLTGQVVAPGSTGENAPSSLSVAILPGTGPQGRIELDGTMNQAVYVIPSETQRPRPVSQTVIQDAIVLGVGSFLEADKAATAENGETTEAAPAAPRDGTGQETPEEPKLPTDITLIVSPQDAVTLNYLMVVGAKLNLALRSAGDAERLTTEAVTLQFLMDQYNIPNPAKLPYSLEPRIDELIIPETIVVEPVQ